MENILPRLNSFFASPIPFIAAGKDWLDIATSLATILGIFTFGIEYFRQRRESRFALAQQLIGEMDSDEMMIFAVNRLDWAAGKMPIPNYWKETVGMSFIVPNNEKLYNALRPKLTESTVEDSSSLFQRHSFVRLFNHLEKLALLERNGNLNIRDLKSIAWIAKELVNYKYAGKFEKPDYFLPAIKAWYPQKVLLVFIYKLNSLV